MGRRSRTAARWARSSSTAIRDCISGRILRPFLDHYLKDERAEGRFAPVTAFETGTNTWQRLAAWPPALRGDSGCAPKSDAALSDAGLKAEFRRAEAGERGLSTNMFPIRQSLCLFAHGPSSRWAMTRAGLTWPQWLVDDQREASGRTDVLAFTSDVLTAPVTSAVSLSPIWWLRPAAPILTGW